jgi:hypothetical protein
VRVGVECDGLACHISIFIQASCFLFLFPLLLPFFLSSSSSFRVVLLSLFRTAFSFPLCGSWGWGVVSVLIWCRPVGGRGVFLNRKGR